MKGNFMKALLVAVNAKYIHSNLAVHSIMAYSSYYGEHIDVAEYTINNQMDFPIRDIYERRPDVIFFSCYIWNIEYVRNIAREVKKVIPDIRVWFGGPEVSYDGVEILEKNPYLDGVMIGEGEQVFKHLMEYYCDGTIGLTDIPGIMYRTENGPILNERQELMPMDDLVFVYDDISQYNNRIIYYESSRGCPFRCSYCMSSIDKTVRFRSLCLVKKELKYFLDNNVPQVKFIDRTFNIREDRTLEILKFIYENDNGITNFHFEIAADLISDSELEVISKMRPGLIQLEIGVQSTNCETIREIDRVTDFDKIKEVVKKLKKNNNVHIHLDLIAGLPKEDKSSFINSFNDVYALRPHELQLGFLKVLKGAKMHRMADRYGIKYLDSAPYEVLCTKWLSFQDIIDLKLVENMVEVYYNSGLFTNTLSVLERFFENPYRLYEGLGRYYKDNGLLEMNHTRITRYRILIGFIRTQTSAPYEALKEVLTYDLYLRENLKTRPDFSCPNEEYKELTREHYRTYSKLWQGRNFHIEPFSIDVSDFIEHDSIKKENTIILFDYDNKHPITKMAEITVLNEE